MYLSQLKVLMYDPRKEHFYNNKNKQVLSFYVKVEIFLSLSFQTPTTLKKKQM